MSNKEQYLNPDEPFMFKMDPNRKWNWRAIESADLGRIHNGDLNPMIGLMDDLAFTQLDEEMSAEGRNALMVMQYGMQYLMFAQKHMTQKLGVIQDFHSKQSDQIKQLKKISKQQDSKLKKYKKIKEDLNDQALHYEVMIKKTRPDLIEKLAEGDDRFKGTDIVTQILKEQGLFGQEKESALFKEENSPEKILKQMREDKKIKEEEDAKRLQQEQQLLIDKQKEEKRKKSERKNKQLEMNEREKKIAQLFDLMKEVVVEEDQFEILQEKMKQTSQHQGLILQNQEQFEKEQEQYQQILKSQEKQRENFKKQRESTNQIEKELLLEQKKQEDLSKELTRKKEEIERQNKEVSEKDKELKEIQDKKEKQTRKKKGTTKKQQSIKEEEYADDFDEELKEEFVISQSNEKVDTEENRKSMKPPVEKYGRRGTTVSNTSDIKKKNSFVTNDDFEYSGESVDFTLSMTESQSYFKGFPAAFTNRSAQDSERKSTVGANTAADLQKRLKGQQKYSNYMTVQEEEGDQIEEANN